ncbi:MAG: hypothetical protein ACKPKO_59580, partial [Candidatus Fonsibacter sp.]
DYTYMGGGEPTTARGQSWQAGLTQGGGKPTAARGQLSASLQSWAAANRQRHEANCGEPLTLGSGKPAAARGQLRRAANPKTYYYLYHDRIKSGLMKLLYGGSLKTFMYGFNYGSNILNWG